MRDNMKEIKFDKGLTEEKVIEISKIKNEPEWMRDFRVNSYREFIKKELPSFGPKIDIDFDDITYYKRIDNNVHNTWNEVEEDVKDTFDNIGLIDQEKEYLDGLGVQYDSEAIYHNMIKELEEKNIIFLDTDTALKKYPDLFKKYFNTLVKYDENKFSALNGAVWSGGTFIYIPPHTKLDRPLQSYFRINTKDMGQFERTLIIVDEDSELHYIEGCTAPTYTTDSLHAAVVEIFVGKNAKCRYTTIQNWSNNIYNLVTKRAIVEENGLMEWIDGNIGSKVNMKYPACILKGDNSKGNCISIAMGDNDQVQDTGAKMIHLGKNTESSIIAKSIARNGGNATYRGIVSIEKSAKNSKASVKCDTILLDELSKSDTIPTNICKNETSKIEHEATVSKINEEHLFYLMSRGIDIEKAIELSIIGFIEVFREELPLEYAIELNNLLKNNFKPLCKN
jgi:Fe-S cluster assembly protein SufB